MPRTSSMVRLTGSRTPFQHPTPLNRETWVTFHQPSRSIYQPHLGSLKILHSEHLSPLKNSLHIKHFFKSFMIFSPGLDLSIAEHCINTRPNVAPIRQNKWPIYLSKTPIFKAEIEKLHTAGFIYPIAYTTWVSNPVPVNKKRYYLHLY